MVTQQQIQKSVIGTHAIMITLARHTDYVRTDVIKLLKYQDWIILSKLTHLHLTTVQSACVSLPYNTKCKSNNKVSQCNRVVSWACGVQPVCFDISLSTWSWSSDFTSVSDLCTRHRLCSVSTAALVIPATRHSKLSDRAFPVTAARLRSSLSGNMTTATSLLSMRQ